MIITHIIIIAAKKSTLTITLTTVVTQQLVKL